MYAQMDNYITTINWIAQIIYNQFDIIIPKINIIEYNVSPR